jgi:hypothetical protein
MEESSPFVQMGVKLSPSFSPWVAAAGGALIGGAAALNLYLAGRVTGISGIFGRVVLAPGSDFAWSATFLCAWPPAARASPCSARTGGAPTRASRPRSTHALVDPRARWPPQSHTRMSVSLVRTAGLVAGGAVVANFVPSAFGHALPTTLPAVLLSGALVGYGTRLGNGCTSGHGVCGLSRMSARSAAAVGSFMAAGVATASAIDLVPQLRSLLRSPEWIHHGTTPDTHAATLSALESTDMWSSVAPLVAGAPLGIAALAALAAFIVARRFHSGALHHPEVHGESLPWALAMGLVFSAGLSLAGMTNPFTVLSFLTLPVAGTTTAAAGWNPALAMVMGGAIGVALPNMQNTLKALKAPRFGALFHLPTISDVDRKLLAGSALFGVGWGMGGICPGPGLAALGTGAAPFALWVAALYAGMRVQAATAAAAAPKPAPVTSQRDEPVRAAVGLKKGA